MLVNVLKENDPHTRLLCGQFFTVHLNILLPHSSILRIHIIDYPGDVGFDPLGLKPDDPKAFADIQTKEIQNGRLAMLGVAGMCAQELVNHRTIGETLNFYQQIYSGTNPYEGCGDSVIC